MLRHHICEHLAYPFTTSNHGREPAQAFRSWFTELDHVHALSLFRSLFRSESPYLLAHKPQKCFSTSTNTKFEVYLIRTSKFQHNTWILIYSASQLEYSYAQTQTNTSARSPYLSPPSYAHLLRSNKAAASSRIDKWETSSPPSSSSPTLTDIASSFSLA
jgi:hypothetical protein